MSQRHFILVIDDDEAMRESIVEALGDDGYEVAQAENGAEALSMLGKMKKPCCIVLDLMMPVMNGWQFRTLQKQDPQLEAVPVIVVTAIGTVEKAAIDVSEILLKPLTLDTLLTSVHRHCASAASGR